MFSETICNLFYSVVGRKNKSIWVISDKASSITQPRELAKSLAVEKNIREFNYLDPEPNFLPYPDLAIGVGYNVADRLLEIKARSNNKTRIAIILDPLKNYDDFDFIILPSYEPYNLSGQNILYTTGLINFVSPGYLKKQLKTRLAKNFIAELKKQKLLPPYTALIIGGKHTGGNISVEDVEIIANHLSKKGGTLLVSTSKRTEITTAEKLKSSLTCPNFFYDHKIRKGDNPYSAFLALADEIIVTGDSVRMMSEACSSGKKVRIYKPKELGFQYPPLIEELIKGKYAADFFDENPQYSGNHLNEARRLGKIIFWFLQH